MIHDITGVILAGGEARRFGGVKKSRLKIGDTEIISRIIQTLHEIFKEIIIITNDTEEYSDIGNCRLGKDIFQKKGPLGGIHAAFCETVTDALFIVGGDMPFLNKKLIIRQINRYKKNKPDALIPVRGRFTEPLHGIYNRSNFDKLTGYLENSTDPSINDFLRIIDVSYWKVKESEENSAAFTNINSPDDLLKILKSHNLPS